MKRNRGHLLLRYPYLSDGQFASENAQRFLAEDCLARLEAPSDDFVRLSKAVFVHARKLPWDSEHFGVPMGRVEHFYFKNPAAAESAYAGLQAWARKLKLRHLSVRLNYESQAAVNFLLGKGFQFITGKQMLRADTRRASAPTPTARVRDEDLKALLGVAAGNFRANRFMLDPVLDKRKSAELYELWTSAELKKNRDRVVLLKERGRILGFSLLDKVRLGAGKHAGLVNLIAVHKAAQGRGVGRRLLNLALARFKREGVRTVYANVVSTNYPSLGLFQACGFHIYSNLLELRKYTP